MLLFSKCKTKHLKTWIFVISPSQRSRGSSSPSIASERVLNLLIGMPKISSMFVRFKPLKRVKTSLDSIILIIIYSNSASIVNSDFLGNGGFSRAQGSTEWGRSAMVETDDLLFILECFVQKFLNSLKVIEQKLLLSPSFWALMKFLKMSTKPISWGSSFKIYLLGEVKLKSCMS